MATMDTLLQFWFGPLDPNGKAAKTKSKMWWTKSPELDQSLRDQFQTTHAQAMAGDLDHWRQTPRGALAWIILLDQLSRNMYRDTPQMYAADHLTVPVVHQGIETGFDRQLQTDEAVFFYMPLMHSETLSDQQACVDLFTALAERCPPAVRDAILNNVKYAVKHMEVVQRFGRFPHRNAILGRQSTPEELAFLKQPGSSF